VSEFSAIAPWSAICFVCKQTGPRSITADAAAEQPALLAEVERLRVELADVLEIAIARGDSLGYESMDYCARLEQLRPANEREAAARVECGRLNGQAAGKVKELLAEVERLRDELAEAERLRDAYKVELGGLCKAMADSSLLPTGFIAAELRKERIEALYDAFGADETKWPDSAKARLAGLQEDQARYEARYT